MFGMFTVLYTIIGIVTFLLGLILYYNINSIFSNSMTLEELEKARIMVLLMVFNLQ